MSDNSSSKVLLSEWKLDTSSWNKVIKEAKDQLASLSEVTKSQAAQEKSSAESSLSYLKQEQALQEAVTAETKAQTAQIQKAAAEEKKRADSVKESQLQAAANAAAQRAIASAQLESARAEAAAKKAAADAASSGIRNEILQREANIKKIQEETAALRLQKTEQAKEGRAQGEGQAEGSILGRFATAGAKGIFGGGLLGGLVTGTIAGGAAIAGIEFLTEGLEKLIEKVKEFIEDTGSLQKVLDTFQKLSYGFGQNPTEFLDKLREATHGLVNDTNLLRTANAFMQSGLKVSVEDMLKLTQATVGLARANGKDASQAVDALNRSFLTGRASTLAFATGIQRAALQFRGMTTEMSQQQRQQAQFAQTMQVITKRYEEVGEPALTYTDKLQQLKVKYNQVTEAFSQSTVKSAGFDVVMQLLGRMIDSLGGAEEAGKKFGAVFGDVLGGIAENIHAVFPLFQSLFGVIKDISGEVLFSNSFFSGMDEATTGISKLHQAFLSLSDTILGIVGRIRQTALEFQLYGRMASELIHYQPGFLGQKDVKTVTYKEQMLQDPEYQKALKKYSGSSYTFTGKTPDEQASQEWMKNNGLWDEDSAGTTRKQQATYTDETLSHVAQGGGLSDRLEQAAKAFNDANNKQWGQLNTASDTNWTAAQRAGQETMLRNMMSDPSIQAIYKQYDQKLGGLPDSGVSGNYKQQKELNDKLLSTLTQLAKEKGITPTQDQLQAAIGTSGGRVVDSDIPDPALARRNALAQARADMESKQKDAQEALAKQKELIQEETDANEAMYKKGGEEAQEYYNKKIQLAYASFHATENQVEAEAQARKDELTAQLKEGTLQGGERTYRTKISDIDKDTETKIINARKDLEKQVNAAVLAEDENLIQAQIANLQTVLQAEKAAAADRTAVVQKEFEEGTISANQYLRDRLAIIQEITDKEKETQTHIAALQVQNPKEAAETIKALVVSLADAKKQIDQLSTSSLTTVFQDTAKQFNDALSTNSALQNIAEGGGAETVGANKLELQQQQVQLLNSQVQAMQQLLDQAEPYSNTWYTIYQNILKATEQAQQLTQEIQKEQAISTTVGGVLGSIAQQAQGIFKGTFSSGFVRSLAAGAASLQQQPQIQQQLNTERANIRAGKPGQIPQTPLQQEQAQFAQGVQQLSQHALDAGTGLEQFTNTIQQVLQQLASAIDGFKNSVQNKVLGIPAKEPVETTQAQPVTQQIAKQTEIPELLQAPKQEEVTQGSTLPRVEKEQNTQAASPVLQQFDQNVEAAGSILQQFAQLVLQVISQITASVSGLTKNISVEQTQVKAPQITTVSAPAQPVQEKQVTLQRQVEAQPVAQQQEKPQPVTQSQPKSQWVQQLDQSLTQAGDALDQFTQTVQQAVQQFSNAVVSFTASLQGKITLPKIVEQPVVQKQALPMF